MDESNNQKIEISDSSTINKQIEVEQVEVDTDISSNSHVTNHHNTFTISQEESFDSKSISIPKPEPFWYKKIGRTIALISDKNGNPYFIIGPDWKMFVCFSSTMTFIMLLFIFVCWDKFSLGFQIIGYISFGCFFFSYFHTFAINPGYPKNTIEKFTGKPKKDYRFCELCKFYVKKRSLASHCTDCWICVEQFDHHCYWVGKCVAKNNLLSFKIFLVSTVGLICFFGCAVVNACSTKTKK